ncbi:hypothetical protein EW146_g8206 [Bondarzewia mesenterica]|uniref:Uncharacterized protein n=1 Tax=Bondarzewia mesenterica TaxID=1095465 RepID=A0A4V6S1B3_9AGAM|nr:hypothetical protein EW146_g8206 [Bondarzewia mesenterica]
MSVQTNYEDLARLGWFRQQIFERANARRGGTMGFINHLHLNNDFTNQWGYLVDGIATIDLVEIRRRPQIVNSENVVWYHDNSQSLLPFTYDFFESYEEVTTATATISKSSEVRLDQSFTIRGIASSGISISIQWDSSQSRTEESRRTREYRWRIAVPAGWKLELIRNEVNVFSSADYQIESKCLTLESKGGSAPRARDLTTTTFGQVSSICLGTSMHAFTFFKSYDVNDLLWRPRGSLTIHGTSRQTSYSFSQKTTSPTGEVFLSRLGARGEVISEPMPLVAAAPDE